MMSAAARSKKTYKWEELNRPLPDSLENKQHYSPSTATNVGGKVHLLCIRGRDSGVACMVFDVRSRSWTCAQVLSIQPNLAVRQAILIDDFIIFWAKETYQYAREALVGHSLFKLDLVTFEASKIPVTVEPFKSENHGTLVGAPLEGKRQLLLVDDSLPNKAFIHDIEAGTSTPILPKGKMPSRIDKQCSVVGRSVTQLFVYPDGANIESRLHVLRYTLKSRLCQWSTLEVPSSLTLEPYSTFSYLDGCIIMYGGSAGFEGSSQVLLYDPTDGSGFDMADSENGTIETVDCTILKDMTTKSVVFHQGILFFGGSFTTFANVRIMTRTS